MPPKKGSTAHNKKIIDLELMKKLYYEDKKDYKFIANYFGFKSKSAIYDRFKKLNLKARTNTDLKTGFKHSEETKRKLSLARRRWKHSEETKRKMSERVKGEKNPMFGIRGEKHPAYKGGFLLQNGYKMLCKNCKPILESHYVWEKENKQSFPKGMHLHHINRDKLDNRIENLQLMTPSDHSKLHHTDQKIDLATGRFL